MIRAERVSKKYPSGTQALNEVSLSISPGEFVAVIGRSGSGKTTLLRQFNGTIPPTSGRLEVLGVDLMKTQGASQLRALRRQIGFVYQQFNLVKTLTAHENI